MSMFIFCQVLAVGSEYQFQQTKKQETEEELYKMRVRMAKHAPSSESTGDYGESTIAYYIPRIWATLSSRGLGG